MLGTAAIAAAASPAAKNVVFIREILRRIADEGSLLRGSDQSPDAAPQTLIVER
jgi:hypothetical protein